MPIERSLLFDTQRIDLGQPGSQTWCLEIFERAYCGINSPFEKVCERLRLGFSVLVYLPGNCMASAADYVKAHLQSGSGWNEFGVQTEKTKSFSDMWQHTGTIFTELWNWYNRKNDYPPRSIFHNLNLLSDNHRNILTHDYTLQAVYSLIENTRRGVVLGLSDREAGELPEALTAAFDEQTWLNEIPLESFPRLIPELIMERGMLDDTMLPDAANWLLASRLRWNDPFRAVTIMQTAIEKSRDFESIIDAITVATRSVQFVDPQNLFSESPSGITGFEPATLSLLRANIIEPFQRLTVIHSNYGSYEEQFSKLPPGLVLHGPPGTGKTYLARWISKSIGLPVRTVKGADIRTGEWGLAEKNVHRLFAEVRRAAPCVLVLDDADDLFPNRSDTEGSVASGERAVVNAALQELQGFSGALDGVLLILTTNRYASLDRAITERLPMHFRIPYPLNEKMIGQIVDQTALEFRIDIYLIRDGLIDRFMIPVKPETFQSSGSDRRLIPDGLFSPREIRNAIRLLNPSLESDHQATIEDLERMKFYYDQLVQ